MTETPPPFQVFTAADCLDLDAIQAEEAALQSLPCPAPMTWAALQQAEPGLYQVARAVRYIAALPCPRQAFCANTALEWVVLPLIRPLVGWERHGGPPWMRTSPAYDVAWRYLYALLPDCRRCACA